MEFSCVKHYTSNQQNALTHFTKQTDEHNLYLLTREINRKTQFSATTWPYIDSLMPLELNDIDIGH